MADLADSYVSWDDIVALARRIVASDTGNVAHGAELAELVVRFHAQTVGAAASSGITRTVPEASASADIRKSPR